MARRCASQLGPCHGQYAKSASLFGELGATIKSIEHEYAKFDWIFFGSTRWCARAQSWWPRRRRLARWRARMGCRSVGATFFGIGEFTIQRYFFYFDPD